MGYTTEFTGAFKFNKTVDDELVKFINRFADIRHMKRDNSKIKEIFPNWKDLCYNGELGIEGEFFIGGTGFGGLEVDGQYKPDDSVVELNTPSRVCPGLYCQWVIENNQLVWDGNEKFHKYIDWLEYLIYNFFEPNEYILSGQIEFQGEDETDHGYIDIIDNEVIKTYL